MKGSSIRMTPVWPLFVFLAFLALSGWATEVLALDDETSGQSLVGLQGISVMVPPITPDPEPAGLKREQVLADVEMKLGKAGIKMLTERELARRDFSYLSIDINAVKGKNSELYSYDLKVELYKQDILNPDDVEETNEIGFAIVAPVKTWSSELKGSAPGSDLKNSVQKHVDELVDKFIKAYFTANPKNNDLKGGKP